MYSLQFRIHQLGGIDLQLLGIGNNGHIGFNEPSDTFAKETHCVELTKTTIQGKCPFLIPLMKFHSRIYDRNQNIMEAKHILLIANGEGEKRIALYQSLFGPITPQVPASILQLHDDVSIVADEAALSRIIEKSYLILSASGVNGLLSRHSRLPQATCTWAGAVAVAAHAVLRSTS